MKTLPVPTILPDKFRNEPCPCGSGKKYKKCCYVAACKTNGFKLRQERLNENN